MSASHFRGVERTNIPRSRNAGLPPSPAFGWSGMKSLLNNVSSVLASSQTAITKGASQLTWTTIDTIRAKTYRRGPRLRFDMLNTDVILDIFRFYVATQPDGVFILILVSRSWQNLVMQSPILWQWITVDMGSPDSIIKTHICAELSQRYPLQVVLRLPIQDWSTLIPLLSRFQTLFVQIPDYMTGRDATEASRELLAASEFPKACEIHWYRAGEALTKEDRDIKLSQMPNIRSLDLDADGSEFANYHLYATTRDIRYIESGDTYCPLILLKTFHLLEILRNAPYLTSLSISHHTLDPIFLDLDLPIVTLNDLQDLKITGLNSRRNGSLYPLVESLKCPNIASLSLFGSWADTWSLTRYIGAIGQPATLHLRLQDCTKQMRTTVFSRSLASIAFLHITVEGFDSYNLEKDKIARYIIMYIKSLTRLSELRLAFISNQPTEDMRGLLFLIPPDWSTFKACSIHVGPQDAMIPLLEYTRSPKSSMTMISGLSSFVYDFARALEVIGGFDISRIGHPLSDEEAEFPAGAKEVKFIHLNLTSSELANTKKRDSILQDFKESCHSYTVARFTLPSIDDFERLGLPESARRNIKAFIIDTDKPDEELSIVENDIVPGSPSVAVSGIGSILLAQFASPYYAQQIKRPHFDRSPSINSLIGEQSHCSLRSISTLHLGPILGAQERISTEWLKEIKIKIQSINNILRIRLELPLCHDRLSSDDCVLPECIHHPPPSPSSDFGSRWGGASQSGGLSRPGGTSRSGVASRPGGASQLEGLSRLGSQSRRGYEEIDQRPPCWPDPTLISSQLRMKFPEFSTLTQLDIRSDCLHTHGLTIDGSFPALTALMCPIGMLLSFLSQQSFPKLDTIQLHLPTPQKNIEGEFGYFETSITSWLLEHSSFFPGLRTLGLCWFPEWDSLFRMLLPFCQRAEETSFFTLKLPAIPSIAIQKPLRAVMEGKYRNLADIPTWRSRFAPKYAHYGCYYCFASGFDCNKHEYFGSLASYCDRHSPESLVVITKTILSE